MKLIKTLFFLFLITFTTHSFAKSNEYYQATLVHMLTECNTECKKKIFEDEVHKSFFILIDGAICFMLDRLLVPVSLKIRSLNDLLIAASTFDT